MNDDMSMGYRPPRPIRVTRRAWIAVVVLVAVVAALLCWRHLRDGRSHAALGSTLVAGAELDRTTSSSVELPSGRLDIAATRPLDDVDADPEVRELQAPEDGSFVGLQIERAARAAVTRWSFGESAGRKSVDTTFVLVADGRRYPVTRYDAYGRELDADDEPGFETPFVPQRVYVAVAGRPDRLQLEVTYAGAKQVVDLRTGARTTGRFAPLYANRAVSRDCGTPVWTAGFSATTGPSRPCTVDLVQRTPYYPGFGWAPTGRTWVVVGTTTLKPEGLQYRSAKRFTRYESFGLPDVDLTVAGQAAKDTGLFSNVFGLSRRDVSLFTAKTGSIGEVGVKITYNNVSVRTDSVRTGIDYSPTVTSTWKVDLP